MKKKYHEPSFRLPEQLMDDPNLSISAKELALTIFSRIDPDGTLCMSQRRLAALSGLCRDTISRAAQELADAGYITINRRRARWDREKGHYLKRANLYSCSIPAEHYILVPYRLIRKSRARHVHGASLLTLIYFHRMTRTHGRCWPSVARIASDTGLALSTIHVAINLLEELCLIIRQHCRKRSGAFSSNSYFLLKDILCSCMGSPSEIQTNRGKFKITGVLTRGGEYRFKAADFAESESL